jgi:hypothetical protein
LVLVLVLVLLALGPEQSQKAAPILGLKQILLVVPCCYLTGVQVLPPSVLMIRALVWGLVAY